MVNALRNIDRIAQTVRSRLGEAELTPSEEALRKLILRHYAEKGCPPTQATMCGIPGIGDSTNVDQALDKLHRADIITVKDGAIISAYPFATAPSRNRVCFDDGRVVNSLCSTDVLGIHFMLGGVPMTAESDCPYCDATLTLRIEQGRIKRHTPDAMVEFIPPATESCGCVSDASCPYMNFFCSMEHLDAWRANQPDMAGGEIYPPDEVLQHGRYIFEDFLA